VADRQLANSANAQATQETAELQPEAAARWPRLLSARQSFRNASQHDELTAERDGAVAAFADENWREAARKSEQVIRIAGPETAAADHELFAESLLHLRRLDDVHTALLVATSHHPASARVRALALETLRRQRGAEVEHDLSHLARQYIRRYSAASGSTQSVGRNAYSALFLARAGSLRDAARLLPSGIGESGFLAETESNDICILLDLALRQHQFAAAELLIEDGRRRFADDPKLAMLQARHLNGTRRHAEAVDLLNGLFAKQPKIDTPGNRLHLVKALSSDDRFSEAHSVLKSIDKVDHRAITERIKLICKAIDVRFSLTHIDPVELPDSDTRLADHVDEVIDTAASWTSSDDTTNVLRSAGIERTLTTTLMIASRVGHNGTHLSAADTAGPLLDVVFGDRSWSGSSLGIALSESIHALDLNLDDRFALFESELADPELRDRHPTLNAAALERLVLWHGGLRVGHQVNRQDWQHRFSLGATSRQGSELHNAVAAACQLGYRDAIPHLLETLELDQTYSAGRLDALRGYVALLAGDRSTLIDSFDSTSTANERHFRDFLKGKSVALVGPAPGDHPSGDEIDSFDVVLRPNRLKPPTPEQFSRHGSRIDIASFAATRVRQLRHVADPDARHLDPAVGFTLTKYRAPTLSGGAPAIPVPRHTLRHVSSYAMRQVNHLPQIIFYLNSFDISRLKVFNANFFLSRDPWEPDYVPDGRVSDVLTQLVFSDSLDVGQWFVRSLYQSGVVEADEQLASVLDLEPARYMQEMSNLVTR
jgi:hypothetical protein